MLADYETRILAQIDDMVEHATDDELFAGGYLQGHLTLAVLVLETWKRLLQTAQEQE